MQNRLDECKSYLDLDTASACNVIVGAKVVEVGICEGAVYKEVLRKIIDDMRSNGMPIYYVSHRGEAEENLAVIERELSVKVIRNELPIELIKAECKLEPVNVASIISTALYTMPKLYDKCNFILYPLPMDKIKKNKEGIRLLYKDLGSLDYIDVGH